MWIARGKAGELNYFFNKPERRIYNMIGFWVEFERTPYNPWPDRKLGKIVNPKLFPEVTWDTKPKWKRFIRPEWVHVDS